ncbi:ATP-grasp domain-containing protein [Methylocella silvestris]|uniref:ATP-grasp domain-containing protein n=1 Tax=Methylocella silvestris TaxID=199596 RepID=A0A2J7TH69_METSI|nr:ATP-grasp domain-containing protein [Methylocella silvestris]PNG26115.1 hypothetical protein CR492_09685 [Methylocella silvestris]
MSGLTKHRGAAVLIAASSGRALAAAARRAGFRPLVADLFDDSDTRGLCAASLIAGDWRTGFSRDPLIAALETLAEANSPIGLVYGAGFEDRPSLLEELAARWSLFGNPADRLRRAKDPMALAALCQARGVPHPDISLALPDPCDGWLVKSVGGAGGSHVAPARASRPAGENVYFQRFAPGEPISVQCLCDGSRAISLGLSRQWTAPAPDEPFRYGGCVRPAGLAADLERRLADAACAIVGAQGLVGLNSVDFLVDGDIFHLIEVNPRPGAAIDIFEDGEGRLFQAHIDACLGRLPIRALEFNAASAAAIAYAQQDIGAMPQLDWPDWTADRQKPQSVVGLYDPLCTIKACAAQTSAARALVEARAGALVDAINCKLGGEAS